MKTYTSKEILKKEDLYDIQDSFSCSYSPFKYIMTEGEMDWLNFVKNRYSIYDWIISNLNDNVLTFDDPHEMSVALFNDGVNHKAVCLSDETALQKLFFWLHEEINE